MAMSDVLIVVGSFLSIVASVLGLITGQYGLAAGTAFISLWGFSSVARRSAFDDIIGTGKSIPPVDDLKQFRHKNPQLSLSEAIVAFQKNEKLNEQ